MNRDRMCVITGTSSGIGLAVAEALLKRGWRVLGLARRESPLRDEGYSHVRLDLSAPEQVEAYFAGPFSQEFPARNFLRLGLVNNAALLEPVAPLAKIGLAELARAYTVNAVVPIWLMGFFLRHCGGTTLRVVNVSSGAAGNSRAGWATYCSTKAALHMAGRVFGDEAEVRAKAGQPDAALLSLEPGIVDTPMQTQVRTSSADDFPSVQRFVDFHTQGKLQRPARPAGEIADFLERDNAPAFSEARPTA